MLENNLNQTKYNNSGVYQILNLINNKLYVGSSVNLNKRWSQHKARLNSNTHKNPHLQSAWNEYGYENFEFIVLEFVEDKTKLIDIEQKWIDGSNCLNKNIGYNIAVKANSQLGLKRSDEARKRMSDAQRGKTASEETRKKLSLAKKGKSFSETHKRNKALAQIGRICTPATRLKMSIANKGRKLTEETKLKMSKTRTGLKRGPYNLKPG